MPAQMGWSDKKTESKYEESRQVTDKNTLAKLAAHKSYDQTSGSMCETNKFKDFFFNRHQQENPTRMYD